MSPRPRRTAYLPALTGLRFVLAAWVMVHHLAGPRMMLGPAVASLPRPLYELAEVGYLAVQTFFLLSGFVLARSYAGAEWNRESLIRYFSARIARIYPTYLFSLAIVSYFIVRFLGRPSLSFATKAWAVFDYSLLLQGWRKSAWPGWNTPAWSLSCELFFYLCLPAILPAIWRAGQRVLVVLVVLSCIAPIVLSHVKVPFYWKPVHHFADFVVGIAAARLFGRLEMRPGRSRFAPRLYLPAMIAGAALIAWPGVLHGTWIDLNSALRPLNAIALIGLALGGGAIARILSTRIIEYLGQASYSMYILHVPLLWWYGNGGLKRLHLPAGLDAAVFAALVIAAAVFSFEFVEKPANRWIRRWTERRLAAPVELRAAA